MQTKEMILQKYFGYSEFRSGQSELIEQILNGRPVVAVMPTGAGKSLCYQLPALMLEGLTLVVSPLISLMKDQVRSLAEHGVEAAYLSSGMSKQRSTVPPFMLPVIINVNCCTFHLNACRMSSLRLLQVSCK